MLKAEGYLRSRMGKGVYVAEREPLVVPAVSYLAPTDGEFSYQLIEVAEVSVPADVSAVLGVETAVLRSRLMRHNGDPVEHRTGAGPPDSGWRAGVTGRARPSAAIPR